MKKFRGFGLEEGVPLPVTPSTPITITSMATEGPVISTIGSPNDNHIYFYEDIDQQSSLRLIRDLRNVDIHFRKERIERGVEWGVPWPPIWLHIQSYGGEVFSSLAVADCIKHLAVPVYSIIEGTACSGATIISAACRKRYMYRNSFMMIHQVSGGNWGTYDSMKDELNILKLIMKSLIKFYTANSLMSKNKVTEMLKHDSWLTAKKAQKRGFIDFIIGEDDLDDTDYESELYKRRAIKGSKDASE